MEFALLINVKLPTIVDILTFISMINTTAERLKARNFFIYRYLSSYQSNVVGYAVKNVVHCGVISGMHLSTQHV